MKIAFLNTFFEGGAAILMRRLARELQLRGHETYTYVKKGGQDRPLVKNIDPVDSNIKLIQERILGRIESQIRRKNAPSYFSRFTKPWKTPLPKDFTPDIVHLHWVGQWIDLPSLIASIPVQTPIVWTIHDMSPLAGGCFTDFGCNQFGKGCNKCPLIKPAFDRFYASNELNRRKRILSKRKIFAVGNSAFTTELIKKSELFFKPYIFDTIHPAIDFSECFDTQLPRRSIAQFNSIVLGFGAASLTDENKGVERFLKVAEKVAQRLGPIEVKLFGEGEITAQIENVRIQNLGALRTTEALREAYSSIDAFVITSRMETFGQVSIEAQACGTPVWAFAVGGLVDTLQDGITGRLIPYADIETMAGSICDSVGALSEMGKKGKVWVRQNFSIQTMTRKYEEVYKAALRFG